MGSNPKIAAIALLCALALAPHAVRAADAVPATAGAFAKFCTPLNQACRDKITVQQVAVLGASLYGNVKTEPCVIPDDEKAPVTQQYDAADKAVIAWLLVHPEAANLPTLDGIDAAAKAIYCQ